MNKSTAVARPPKSMAGLLRWSLFLLAVLLGIARAAAESGAMVPSVAIAYLEDPTGKLTIEQVAAPGMAQRFAPAPDGNLYFGWTDSAYWVRFTLPAGDAASVVVLATPYTDFLDFYRPRADGQHEVTHAGDHRPFSLQELDYRYPAFRVTPSPGSATHFYLRASSAIALDMPLKFLGEGDFQRLRLSDNLWLGLYFGLLLAMALYNLVLYFGVRDRAYLWYVVWVVTFGLFQACHLGLSLQWVLRDAPRAANLAPNLALAVSMAALAIFVRAALGLPGRAPRLDLVVRAVAWLGAIVIAFALAGDFRTSTILLNLQSMATVVAAAVAALVVWRRGYRPARYLAIAMGFLWFCGVVATTHHLGLVSESHGVAIFLAYDGTLIASAIEVVLFAFALADRINLLQDEKERAQALALESQRAALETARRNEHELEQRVTDRTQALARAKDEAQQASLAKTRFLAAASHDLRQPMHAIGLLVGALRERVGEPEARRLVGNIEGSVEAMDGLFNALLDISRLDADAISAQPSEVRLQSLFERLQVTFAPYAQEKGLALRVRPTSAVVRSDAVLLDRILSNLVSNALRYTERGGVLVAARVRSQTLRIEVWDTGVGIPADKQAAVFEEFVQLANPTRDRAKGLGLGLSIVKRAAALLDHPLALHSRPGHGSRVAVTVPLIDRAAPLAVLPQQEAPGADLQGAFVVVVDDEGDILEAMRALLAQFGAHVVRAATGPQAVAALEEHLRIPDLIVSDYRIASDHNGIDAIRMIREAQQTNIPALLITGDSAGEDLASIRSSGLPVIRKPVSAGLLCRAMAETIGEGSPGVPTTPPREAANSL